MRVVTLVAVVLAGFAFGPSLWAQAAGADAEVPPSQAATADSEGPADVGGSSLPPGEDPQNHLLLPLFGHLLEDQRTFWTFPLRIRTQDWRWIVPTAAFTGSVFASDSWIAKQVPQSAARIKQSKDFSNYAVFGMLGVSGGSYLVGQMSHDEHIQEAGFLEGEAVLNSTAVAYLFKEVTQRPRPYQGNGHGTFFQGGSSFPSEHATVAWSVASVWAHEYPGKLSQILAYSLASAVTVARVTSKQHFASDALVGSALGWYFGREVYRRHHDPELGGAPWGPLLERRQGEVRNPASMGSPPVPLDSWVYLALARLSALGYLRTAYLGIRPWTRMQCARLLEEANEGDSGGGDEESAKILNELATEFAPETARLAGSANLGASLDSVYTRATSISGRPLTDGYHFGQTLVNDYGRPYGEGFNNVTGATASGEAGPVVFYLRGEYQHAPAVASDPPAVLQAIANADFTTPVADGRAEVDRFDLLEASAALNVRDVRISFGKESQWLGIGESGSLLMSDNAEPVLMLKLESVFPFHVPWLSRVLGPVQAEYFVGRLAGHQFEVNGSLLLGPGNITPQPYLDGGKVSCRPTPNFEFGMGFTALFAGPGLPFTWKDFLRTFYVHNQSGPTTASSNPAKRASSADFSYRMPGLRDWLTVYADTLVVDEISPLGSSRATVNPGIYMPQLPRLHQMELRAEGIHEPLTSEFAPGFVYYGERRYRSGYTNDGNLMGSWIGRAGRGGQGWLTYRFSPRSNLQFGYRLQEVSHDFLGGGRLADYTAGGSLTLGRAAALSGSVQYEQWKFPVLSATVQSNLTATVQFTFYPKPPHIRQ